MFCLVIAALVAVSADDELDILDSAAEQQPLISSKSSADAGSGSDTARTQADGHAHHKHAPAFAMYVSLTAYAL